MNPDKVKEFFARLKRQNPHPETELKYSNAYTLLVAVVLSAQMTDVGVNKATQELFKIVQTPEDMVALGEQRLLEYIKSINFKGAKARNIITLSRILIEKHGSQVPRTQEELVALPGVGNKTANVVRNVIFGEHTIAVDTHIFRVSNRTGLARAPTPDKVSEKLMKVVPKEFRQHAHHWLILHGRYVCKARKPDCPNCIVRDLCAYKDKTKPDGE
jgi:endonuclease-3